MPINIYIEETGEKLDWLCEDIWDLPNQIEALEAWLDKKGKNLNPNKYVADIGFDIRKHATGGGGVLNSNAMKIMGAIGMDIYFSEYPSEDERTELNN
jgi:hypothetical protein